MTEEKMPHALSLTERNQLTVYGVTEVVSFEENAVVLRTGLGTLVVQGRDMQLKTLAPEDGQVIVEGRVSALVYEEPRTTGGWFSRWLK